MSAHYLSVVTVDYRDDWDGVQILNRFSEYGDILTYYQNADIHRVDIWFARHADALQAFAMGRAPGLTLSVHRELSITAVDGDIGVPELVEDDVDVPEPVEGQTLSDMWERLEPEEEEIQSRRYLLFRDIESLSSAGKITGHIFDPNNQEEVFSGCARLTFIGTDGKEYDCIVKYN